MSVTFTQPYTLSKPEYDSGFPLEKDYWTYDHKGTPDSGTCILSYSLEGEVPSSLSINENGFISGEISSFGFQEYCTNNKPFEMPYRDGTNYNQNGRLLEDYYDFIFRVVVEYKEKNDDEEDCKVYGTVSKDCLLRVKKNFGIDNKIFIDNYKKRWEIDEKSTQEPLIEP